MHLQTQKLRYIAIKLIEWAAKRGEDLHYTHALTLVQSHLNLRSDEQEACERFAKEYDASPSMVRRTTRDGHDITSAT